MPDVTVFYLEMTSPESHKSKAKPPGIEVIEAQVKQFRFNRFLYELVGEPWAWTDKLSLSNEQWRAYAEKDELRTWAAYSQGSVAGYYELEKQAEGTVELAYFGLSPAFIGKGFGGYLLSHAIDSAWAWPGTTRVSVNTCTLDHESALGNYQARGFKLYKQELRDH